MMMKMKIFTVAIFILLIELSSALTAEETIKAEWAATVAAEITPAVITEEETSILTSLQTSVQTHFGAYSIYQVRIIDRIGKLDIKGARNLAAAMKRDKMAAEKIVTDYVIAANVKALVKNFNDVLSVGWGGLTNALTPLLTSGASEIGILNCWASNKPNLYFKTYLIDNLVNDEDFGYLPWTNVAIAAENAKVEAWVSGMESDFKKCNYKWKCIVDLVSNL
jgi:hypothetical protein